MPLITSDLDLGSLMYGRGEVFPLEYPPTCSSSRNQYGPSSKLTLSKLEHVYDLIKHRIAQESLLELCTCHALAKTLPVLHKALVPLISHYLYPNEFGLFWRKFVSISAINRLKFQISL